jgi:hypothetical protein
VSTISRRGTCGSDADGGLSRWVAIGVAGILLLTPGCRGKATGRRFNPGIVALPHVACDPSVVDEIARGANYSAWVDLEDEDTLDLAVWPNRLAATQALRRYRAGGPETYPDRALLGTGWPYHVRKGERLKNVTLAWYGLPTASDEHEVRHALRFRTAPTPRGDYKALWVIPATTIEPDATAATGAALYSARLSSAEFSGEPLIVAIWPSVCAAKNYHKDIEELETEGGPHVDRRRIRNVTIDTAASFGSANISDTAETAIRRALH